MSNANSLPSQLTIIAEVGVNHNGDVGLARKMVDVAKEAGATVVKFQVFNPESLASKTTKTASYQEPTASTQRKMLSKLTLTKKNYLELATLCESIGIEFLATPFDLDSFKFLRNECGLRRIKIASGDSVNHILLWEIAKSGANLILSTGMTTIEELENSLNILALGYVTKGKIPPKVNGILPKLKSAEVTEILESKVTLCHAVSIYPTPPQLSNVGNIAMLKNKFGLNIGLSDHSTSHTSSILAIGMGANLFEKHFTLDKSMPGPDHKASMSVTELKEWVQILKESKARLGDYDRHISQEEIEVKQVVRQHLIAKHDIQCDEMLTFDNLTFTRTGGLGNPTSDIWRLLGQRSSRIYRLGDPINE